MQFGKLRANAVKIGKYRKLWTSNGKCRCLPLALVIMTTANGGHRTFLLEGI